MSNFDKEQKYVRRIEEILIKYGVNKYPPTTTIQGIAEQIYYNIKEDLK